VITLSPVILPYNASRFIVYADHELFGSQLLKSGVTHSLTLQGGNLMAGLVLRCWITAIIMLARSVTTSWFYVD
jgi:hypothetical protein